jgi:hypothetical protein
LARRDTVREIRLALGSEDQPLAQAIITGYERGKLSDEEVDEMLATYEAHRGDADFRETILGALSDFLAAKKA